MPKPKPNPADPDCPLCHGEARDEVCGCVLDAIEAELQRRIDHGPSLRPTQG